MATGPYKQITVHWLIVTLEEIGFKVFVVLIPPPANPSLGMTPKEGARQSFFGYENDKDLKVLISRDKRHFIQPE